MNAVRETIYHKGVLAGGEEGAPAHAVFVDATLWDDGDGRTHFVLEWTLLVDRAATLQGQKLFRARDDVHGLRVRVATLAEIVFARAVDAHPAHAALADALFERETEVVGDADQIVTEIAGEIGGYQEGLEERRVKQHVAQQRAARLGTVRRGRQNMKG